MIGEAEFGPAWSASKARADEAELEGWLRLGHAICDEADALALAHFRRELAIDSKPDRTLVTEADTAVERLARERILRVHPDHGLVGEEYGTERQAAATRWYVDPIDGTSNFVRGVPIFATLLAVERDDELQAAVISAPALGERWWARRGGGAWARGGAGGAEARRIGVSGVTAIEEAHVLYGGGREIVASRLAPGFADLLDAAWRDRGFGDFWGYVLVADGAAEAMVEVGLRPWDAAAPALIVEEAGGRMTDVDGRRGIEAGSFVATNGTLHDDVLARLRRSHGGAPAR